MKIFQVMNGLCYWQTPYRSLSETEGRYAPDIQFVAAPDYVFEGWGYLDGVFIKPTAPEGWVYDEGTGTLYQPGKKPPEPVDIELRPLTPDEDRDAMLVELEYRTTLLELGV